MAIDVNRENSLRDMAAKRQGIVAGYAEAWTRMIRDWNKPRADNAAWLMYSGNYLLNTRGTKWAVDPARLGNRVPEAAKVDPGRDLKDLDFALLTHAHEDHVDRILWGDLHESTCHWLVPEYMLGLFKESLPSDRTRFTVAHPGRTLTLGGVRITPFVAPHSERQPTGRINRVDSTGYLVETDGGSFLFPGDIRTYDPACLQPFKGVQTLFAHVFLGRSAALSDAPPLLDSFIDFFLGCHPRHILLTHLYELGRIPEDCWLQAHAHFVAERFKARQPSLHLSIPDWFEEILL